jgi:HEAT repeat protein
MPKDAKVYIALDKQTCFLGEVVILRYTIENTGEKEFFANFGGDYRGSVRSLRFRVTVTNPDGKTLPDPHPSGFCMGGISSNWRVKPGEKTEMKLMLHRYARIDKAGKYKVRVYHDLGWTETEDRKIPHPETEVELVMPDGEQAGQVLKSMLNVKDPTPDFTALRYSVYLPHLLAHAKKGEQKVLTSLCRIPIPEATKVLIELLASSDGDFAVKVAGALNYRLPDPQLEGKLPGRSMFIDGSEDERTYVIKKSWKPEFREPVRREAKKLLKRSDTSPLYLGAFMLECVGKKEDMPALIGALDTAVKKTITLLKEKGIYPRPRGACGELLRALKMLLARGALVPKEPQSPGEIVVFLGALKESEEFRPEGWHNKLEKFLKHEIAYVRERALVAAPPKVPQSILKIIPSFINDKDIDVRIEACRLAGRTKAPELKEPLLEILRTEKEQQLLSAASSAAYHLCQRVELYRIWVSRLEEPKIGREALNHLCSIVKWQSSGSDGSPSTPEVMKKAQVLWSEFLKEHAEEINAGKRYKMGDSALKAEMFPGTAFRDKDGRKWPER